MPRSHLRNTLRFPPALLLAFFPALLLALSSAGCSARSDRQDTAALTQGETPDSGRVVLRSGLAWMDEDAPVLQPLFTTLRALGKERGWRVVAAAPSRMEPLPDDPLPPGAGQAPLPDASLYAPVRPGASGQAAYRADGRPEAGEDLRNRARAAELAAQGRLPQTAVRDYGIPARDAELPPGVMAVKAPDFETFLFAQSQLRGRPLVRGTGGIPFRIPSEMTASDPAVADYALLVRFAVVAPRVVARVPGGGGRSLPPGGSAGGMGVSPPALIGGVGALGVGVSGGTGLYGGGRGLRDLGRAGGSVGGYMRGYEGSAPGSDFWHRDADYRRRDYARLVGPEPVRSEPPHGLSGPVTGPGSGPVSGPVPGSLPDSLPGSLPSGGGVAALPVSPESERLVLVLDLYDLAPARTGGAPELVWSGSASSVEGADGPNGVGGTALSEALAALAAHLLEEGGED